MNPTFRSRRSGISPSTPATCTEPSRARPSPRPATCLSPTVGLDDDTFNIVATARFTPGTAPARAAQTARILAATGRPFAWWVGPASSPDNLTEHLQASRSTGRSRRGYEQADINDELARGDWAVLALSLIHI